MQFICPLIPKSAAAVGQEQSTWDLCAGPLTRTFIEQASLAHLNTNCLADIPAPVFDLTLP